MLSLQNGLNELIIQRIVGRDRTIGAFINFGADWMAPGEIMFGNRGAVVLGELDGAMTPRLAALHAVMRDFEPDAITTPDIWSYLWGKLGYGAMLFAQALGQKGIADCLARPELLGLWRRLGEEAIVVAQAEGVEPRGFNGYDVEAFRPGAGEDAARQSVAAMVAFNSTSAKTHSGVWRDLAIRKRRTEVDVQIAPDRRDRRAPRHRLPRHAQAGRDDPRGGRGPPRDDRRQPAGTGTVSQLPREAHPRTSAERCGTHDQRRGSPRTHPGRPSARPRRKSSRWPTPGAASPPRR